MADTIHATASIPAQRTGGSYVWGRPAMTPRFIADTKNHELKVCHDVGLYRHLMFAAPGTLNCSFQIFTTPGSLAIAGDMGTYVFARLEDMFHFFDSPEGRINPEYWSEKVTAQDVHCPVRTFSKARFKQVVLQDYEDRKYMFDPPSHEMLLAAIQKDVLDDSDVYNEEAAREVLLDFEFSIGYPGRERVVFSYEDGTEEWDFRDFSRHFLWCLEAIVFGIRRYREVTGNV